MTTAAPPCLRCGYDFSGIVASWRETCPLDGICSECGLDVRWAELLNPVLTVPRWSFEHAIRWRGVALLRTIMRALRSRGMWRDLRMEHPVHPARLAVVAVVGIGAAWMLAAAVIVTLLLLVPWLIMWSVPDSTIVYQAFVQAAWPFGWSYIVGRPHMLPVEPWVLVAAGWWCLLPGGFLALPVTLRRARIRPRHLLRIWVYSLVSLPLALAFWIMPAAVSDVTWAIYARFFNPSGMWTTANRMTEIARHWQWTAFVCAVAIWGLHFWRSAIKNYLRLPHAAGVALAAGAISLGVVLLASLLIPGMAVAIFFNL